MGFEPGGIHFRSLNRRAGALKQRLRSFCTDKLRSLSPFGEQPTGLTLPSFACVLITGNRPRIYFPHHGSFGPSKTYNK